MKQILTVISLELASFALIILGWCLLFGSVNNESILRILQNQKMGVI